MIRQNYGLSIKSICLIQGCIYIVEIIVGIIPKVKSVPEAQPRDTNDQGVLSLLMTVGRKHILMARSVAEGPNSFKYSFLILKFGLKVINSR